MSNFQKPKYRLATGPAIGALTGAGIIAIEQAERYNTDLVVRENGEIVHISAKKMRERLNER